MAVGCLRRDAPCAGDFHSKCWKKWLGEKSNMLKLFRNVIKRRPWIPEPTIIATDLNEVLYI